MSDSYYHYYYDHLTYHQHDHLTCIMYNNSKEGGGKDVLVVCSGRWKGGGREGGWQEYAAACAAGLKGGVVVVGCQEQRTAL